MTLDFGELTWHVPTSAVIPQYKREPILEVEGMGEVLPSLVEIEVTAVGEDSDGSSLVEILQYKREPILDSSSTGPCSAHHPDKARLSSDL